MIPANELRIGNWVLLNDSFCQVEAIRNSAQANALVGGMSVHRSVFPIPLTPELLEKCEFVREGSEAGDDGALQLGELNYEKEVSFLWIPRAGRYMREESVAFWIYRDYGNEQIKIDINCVQHLHQLQNLIFSLCGEELEINL